MQIVSLARNAALLAVLCGVAAVGQQNPGYLKTNVNPGRAGVFIDGKYVGPAANFRIGRKYAVAAGEHEVRLSEPRYEDVVKTVKIEPGKTTKLAETMKAVPLAKPPFGRLRTIADDKFAAVYVNGKYMGHVDEFSNSSQGLQLNPGDYTVKVSPVNGPEGKEERVTIETDKVTIVRAAK
jgi:PEGA domain